MSEMKRCSGCGEEKPRTRDYFGRNKAARDGFDALCKECRRLYMRGWREENPEYMKEWLEAHPGYMEAYGAGWREENPEYVAAYRADPEKRERDNALHRAIMLRRNGRKRGLADGFTADDYEVMMAWWGGRCAVCGRGDAKLKLAVDHWVALDDGRPDNPGSVPWNLVPLCHGRNGCNNSKGRKDAKTWLMERYGEKEAEEILLRVQGYFEWVRGRKQTIREGAK